LVLTTNRKAAITLATSNKTGTTQLNWLSAIYLRLLVISTILAGCLLNSAVPIAAAPPTTKTTSYQSHPPMRPLPTVSRRPRQGGRSVFVDAKQGSNENDGTEAKPWKTFGHALRLLRPGDTLYLRGGIYYEKVFLTQSGTKESPITIRAFPGELVTIDGGHQEFLESPETSWQPFPEGAPGEFVSTRTYRADLRRAPYHFLPAAWEPMWGIENERPLALGHFGDSMVPLHSYRIATDLRATNERWIGDKKEMRDTGIYCGPGLWYNRDTERIHIRLAHHQLKGLGSRGYKGETDPRKIPLAVSVGFGEEVLRVNGVQHVQLQDLVFRGATGSPLLHIYGSQHISLDHVTAFGGFPGLLINASQDIQVTHSAFRGLAAPWSSRAHMKYRGTPSYQIVLRNDQPGNENIEFAWCEFTDDHDFAFLRFAKNLQFHHNVVDNFNDDGLECGPKLRDHTVFIYQNWIGRCLIPLAQHEITKDESPNDHDANSGIYIFRNVFDMRGGTYRGPPSEPDPSGKFAGVEGHLIGDHGSPVWPVMRVYHNTFLRETPVFRNYFLFGLGAAGMRNTERDVFNNIFVQTDRNPGVTIYGKEAEQLREGGNLLWGMKEGPGFQGDLFGKFRASPLFAKSQQVYSAGWTTHDHLIAPGFLKLSTRWQEASDLRLGPRSAAINAGLAIPAQWPDPLRSLDAGKPDIGMLPHNAQPWKVGIDGRKTILDAHRDTRAN